MLTSLTGTRSEAAAYEFTTLTCIPGTMKYKGARIQVLDLPGIIEGAADNRGRGRQVIGTARTCNLILIVLDSAKPVVRSSGSDGSGLLDTKSDSHQTFFFGDLPNRPTRKLSKLNSSPLAFVSIKHLQKSNTLKRIMEESATRSKRNKLRV